MNESPYSDMDKEAYRIAYLIAGYIRNTLTQNEHQELDEWVNANDHNMKLFEDLTDERNIEANLAMMDKVQSEKSFKQLQESGAFKKTAKRFKIRRVWIAAASVVILIGAFLIYRYSGKSPGRNNDLSMTDSTTLKPGGNRATLTLANGAVIDLTTAKNGLIQDGKDSHVSKLRDGELVYEESDSSNGSLAMHTLSIPVGGQYQLKLPDGTMVWLNAKSSIRYPVAFSGKERRVFVTGETFFEVAKDKTKPFRVVADDVTIEAVGTQFNVNAYSNEPFIATTLVEGSVLVTKGTIENILKPGQQAQLGSDNFQITNADISDVIAWKNDQFKFTKTPIDAIMRQIERWYDADVVYQDSVNLHMNATIDRNVPVTRLLRLLEETNQVHFKIDGKKIIVMK